MPSSKSSYCNAHHMTRFIIATGWKFFLITLHKANIQTNFLTAFFFNKILKQKTITTKTPCVFNVETTWKGQFVHRFNVVYT